MEPVAVIQSIYHNQIVSSDADHMSHRIQRFNYNLRNYVTAVE